MSREAHVRICEGVGVRFPHATRLDYFHFYYSGQEIVCIILHSLVAIWKGVLKLTIQNAINFMHPLMGGNC